MQYSYKITNEFEIERKQLMLIDAYMINLNTS